MKQFLVETALLGHGLPSIRENALQNEPSLCKAPLVWLEKGKPVTGVLDDFLPLRRYANTLPRISRRGLDQARKDGLTGFLTASAAMQICAEENIRLAVTAGMGGIGPLPAATVGDDLMALAALPVCLIASAPKDVFDHPATFAWLRAAGVAVRGKVHPFSDGFLCRSRTIALDGTGRTPAIPPLLLLNPLLQSERCISAAQLSTAMEEGTRAQKAGGEYHPAVNAALDRLSGTLSSRLQLSALCKNIALARKS
jgi:hypothetical protein